MSRQRIKWAPVIERAGEVAATTLMTLRQCFYILVSEALIPNVDTSYKTLSRLSAEARRAGSFPSFIDGTRDITRWQTYDGIANAIGATARSYRRDRTEGQPWQVWIAGEKRTLKSQLEDWFYRYGCPIVLCAGYSSQTLCDDVRDAVLEDSRPSLLIYAGDFDPSGEDIARDFLARTNVFDNVIPIAVTADQITDPDLDLTPMPGKHSDPRAARFIARHGDLMQVEVEAVHPDTLRQLYEDALHTVWDTTIYQAVLDRERDERLDLFDYIADHTNGSNA